jgi:hypothetical protein
MKSFIEQYSECKHAKKVKVGPLHRFKDYPGSLPAPWHPTSPKIAKLLDKNPDAGLNVVLCLRFGGECSSGHPQCRKMRGLPVKKDNVKFPSRKMRVK